MGKADSRVTGYAREWEVEPQLWGYAEVKPFKKEGMEFRLYGRKIRAKLVNPSVDWDEFCKRAEDILTTVIFPSCALSRKQDFRFKRLRDWILEEGRWRRFQRVVCRARLKLQDSADVISEERDTEKEDRELCLEIMELSNKNPTLLGALNYYSLALKGADQLATAGNLYMAMEELLARFNKGKKKGKWRWEKLTDNLAKYDPGLTEDKLLTLKQLHRARHAFDDNGNKNDPLSFEELAEYKRLVREYLLAYVRWRPRENR
jgi:hypothetical protein